MDWVDGNEGKGGVKSQSQASGFGKNGSVTYEDEDDDGSRMGCMVENEKFHPQRNTFEMTLSPLRVNCATGVRRRKLRVGKMRVENKWYFKSWKRMSAPRESKEREEKRKGSGMISKELQ